MDLYFKCISTSCAIQLEDRVVITGGTDNNGIYGDPLRRVTSYNYDGFLADLPELLESRIQHGCSHYLNNENQLVKLNKPLEGIAPPS